jgi:hypothetical protein
LTDFSQEEAYILGCLYGRGSLEQEKIVLRFPHVAYDPIGRAIVRELLDRSEGLSLERLYDIPSVKRENIKNLGLKLGKLKNWHPPRVAAESSLLEHKDNVWRINDIELAKEYLKWQEIYLERERSWKDYVIKTLGNVSSFMASQINIFEKIDRFGHLNLIVECKIQPVVLHYLRNTYNIDIGDIYLHNSLSDSTTIFESYDRLLKEHFVRGLADTIATIDRYISKDKPAYRIQFSVINSNLRLPIDICLLLQKYLQIPVYYIGWAALPNEGKNKTYAGRGTRDHLVKVWVVNFEHRFNMPLFMNTAKQEEFLQTLDISRRCQISQDLLDFCPNRRRRTNYINICIRLGCRQVMNLC